MKLAAVLLVATAFLLAGEASAFHSKHHKHHKHHKYTPPKCEDDHKKLGTFLGSRCEALRALLAAALRPRPPP